MQALLAELMPLCGTDGPSQRPISSNVNLDKDGESGVGWHADDMALFGAHRKTPASFHRHLGKSDLSRFARLGPMEKMAE